MTLPWSMLITVEHSLTVFVSLINAGYLLTASWNSRRATVGAWTLAVLCIGVAAQSAFIGLILLPRTHPTQWQEARGWLLAGVLALASSAFLTALILSRIRRRRP